MKRPRTFFLIVCLALALKIFLFQFSLMNAPKAKFQPDTWRYLLTGRTLAQEGVFAIKDSARSFQFETFRSPGYPLFLGILHFKLHVPYDMIVLLQIILTIIAAYVVYLTTLKINDRLAFFSAGIILFDLPITIFSLLLLSEALYLFLIALFMYCFISYLHDEKCGQLICSGLFLSLATYVRCISYYLGFGISLFIVYALIRRNPKKSILHSLIFLIVVYSCLGLWQYRNYLHTRQPAFAYIDISDPNYYSLIHSYQTRKDPATLKMGPVSYYTNVSLRCLASLMTRPGTLKYFNSDTLKHIGKFVEYPWIAFWLLGFLVGVTRVKKNIDCQFLLVVICYFIVASIVSISWQVGSRFRVPMMPAIAILSACGLNWIKERLLKNKPRQQTLF